MKRMILAVASLSVLAALVSMMPDLRRYIRMRTM